MFKTLAARLTFLYLLLFSILSLLVFGIISYSLEENLLSRADGYFVEEAGEFTTILEQGGMAAVRHEIRLETESKGVEQLFIRIYSPASGTVAVSDLRSWSTLPEFSDILLAAPAGSEFTMVDLPRGNARIFHRSIGQGYVFQAGMFLIEDQLLLNRLRRFFAIGFVCTLIGGSFIGFCISRRALRGVHTVRERAELIGQGDLSQEILFQDKTEEINHLIAAVNQMQRRIKKLIQELQDVTNNIAHDLRSPVTRMRGLAETALTGESTEEDYRYMAGAVVEECDSLVGMINTMLEIAEADAGIKQLELVPLDVALMLQDLVDLFSTLAEDKHIRLGLTPVSGPLLVAADRSRLQRAFANLLDNAIKFTPVDGAIQVYTEVADEQVSIHIVDTGTGISKTDLPRVCERFFRGDGSRSASGTGLGLSLVQMIAHSHGGELRLLSEEGQGTEAILRLPLV